MENKVITKDVLKELGFDNNHPDFVLSKWHKHSKTKPEWNITLETEYIPNSNDLAYTVNCWKENSNGVIGKRCQAGYINTVGELIDILKVCGLETELNY